MFLTLKDTPLFDVPTMMARILPPEAYKAIPYTNVVGSDGSTRELTDINPAYFIEFMNDVFGPVGFGWFYQYESMNAEFDPDAFKGKGGWTITISNLSLYYKYKDENGEVFTSDPVVASGGVKMQKRDHAERGAITNALSSAGAKMGWQNWVYKGIVHHGNVAQAYKHQQEQAATTA